MVIIMISTSIIFVFFGSGDVQPWDDIKQYRQSENEKENKDGESNGIQLKSIEDGKTSK
jgi:MFS transporter, ACS family, solute carrier family 17 (sodium-dependent inorganic phosphate cotransporter), other